MFSATVSSSNRTVSWWIAVMRAVCASWGDVKLTPTTYIVNKQGQIVKRYVGEPDFNELHRLIEKLLAET